MEPIDTRRGIIAWFARNSVAANLLMIVIMVGGLFTVFTINKEVFPTFELNRVIVSVAYPGAAPQEIEEGIVIKIEEEIRDIDGVKRIRSTSSESLANISIEVEDDYEPKDVLDEVKVRVDAISTFPDSIEQPNIYQVKPTPQVMWLSITGDSLSRFELKELGKEVRDDIKGLHGVTKVELFGARDYEIAIEVSEDKLREYRLTFADVAQAVQQSSVNIPGGSIRANDGNILLRADGQAYTGDDFASIILRSRADGSRLYLSDVANVSDGFEEGIGYTRFNGKHSVGVEVSSVDDQNALAIAESVKKYIKEKQATLPKGVAIEHWGELTRFLEGRLNLMLSNMVQGIVLVLIVLALFLQLKVAFWVMMGLPISFLGALLIMPLEPMSLSINLITLFAFIMVLGIVVDDAIVIGESSYAQMEKDGHSADSIIKGAKKVAMPATFGVLTTIVAFVPMLMLTGAIGTITGSIAGVVILCLAFSLIESKWILPAHLVHMKPPKPGHGWGPWVRFKESFQTGIQHFIHKKYKPFLALMMNWRYSVLTFFIGLMMLCGGLLASGTIRVIQFPDIPSDFIQVQIEMEQGVSEEQTLEAIQQMEDTLFALDDAIKAETGLDVINSSFVDINSRTSAIIFVDLTDGELRPIDSVEIATRWRNSMPELAGLRMMDINARTGNSAGDISFRLDGKDLDKLVAASDELKRKLASYEGLYDIQDNVTSGSQEIQLAVKPEAEALGITLADLARQVRWGFYGYEAQRILRNKEEVKVMVRYPAEQRRTIGHLENMRIRTATGTEVPFSSVATLELAKSYSSITRTDGVRSIKIEAKAHKGLAEPQKITKEITEEFLPQLTQKYEGVSSALDGSAEEDAENLVNMIKGAFFALFTIFALMAIPLKSYSQPMIIMSVIPFGIIGAVFGHLILGLDISTLSILGIVALAGVVVNDSLVMVDFVNKARAEGAELKAAVVQAGTQRFRAIVLTSATTFLGLLPITFETSLQAQIVIPMAVSVAFGILFSTLVTLILVPILYLILDDFKRLLRWWWRPGGVAYPLRER